MGWIEKNAVRCLLGSLVCWSVGCTAAQPEDGPAADATEPPDTAEMLRDAGADTSQPRPDTSRQSPDTGDDAGAGSDAVADTNTYRAVAEDYDGPGDFVVHGWGTLTAVAGSDGSFMRGLHHGAPQLPSFVHRLGYRGVSEERLSAGEAYLPGPVSLSAGSGVMHFFSKGSRNVELRLRMPSGWPTAWFPRPEAMRPQFPPDCKCSERQLRQAGLDELADGELSWSFELDYQSRRLLDLPASSPWQAAREVPSAGFVVSEAEADRFLYHAGLATDSLPMSVTTRQKTATFEVTIENDAEYAFGDIYLFDVHETQGRYLYGTGSKELAAGGSRTFSPAPKESPIPKDLLASRAKNDLTRSLREMGLRDREAAAAADAWLEPIFRESGYRLLVLLPNAWAAENFPVDISPTPDELKRVFAARVEILKPAQEAAARDRILRAHSNGESLVDVVGEGRFREALFRRGCRMVTDQKISRWCEGELREVGAQRFSGDE